MTGESHTSHDGREAEAGIRSLHLDQRETPRKRYVSVSPSLTTLLIRQRRPGVLTALTVCGSECGDSRREEADVLVEGTAKRLVMHEY